MLAMDATTDRKSRLSPSQSAQVIKSANGAGKLRKQTATDDKRTASLAARQPGIVSGASIALNNRKVKEHEKLNF